MSLSVGQQSVQLACIRDEYLAKKAVCPHNSA